MKLRFVLGLSILALALGCGSDSSGPGGGGGDPDFGGIWNVELTVASKVTCDGTIGQTRDALLVIAQQGEVATVILEQSVVPLSVDGSNATGSVSIGNLSYEYDLTIEGNQLGGTLTRTDNSLPCTEVESVSGTRDNSRPSNQFAGYWDLELTVSGGSCPDILIGEIQEICERIQVSGNTVWLDEDEGNQLLGVGDGNFVRLQRFGEDEWITAELTVSGNTLTGTVNFEQVEDQCNITGTVSGTRRSSPCPEPGGSFHGYWQTTGQIITNECGLEFGPECEEFEQIGNTVEILDDGLVGTVSGNTLTIHQEESLGGTVSIIIDVVLVLSQDQNSFNGTNTIRFEDSENPEEGCETSASVVGTRVGSCQPAAARSLLGTVLPQHR